MIIRELSMDGMARWAGRLRDERVVFVTTNGCFDLLHGGHISLLHFCAKQTVDMMLRPKYEDFSPRLLVLLNTDDSVAKLKKGRPILPWEERAAILNSISGVNYVLPLPERDPAERLKYLRPAVHVKDESYRSKAMPERVVVESFGGEVAFAPLFGEMSTTAIVDRVVHRFRLSRNGEVVVRKETGHGC